MLPWSILLAACATPTPSPAEPPVSRSCITTWKRTSADSLLREQRALGGAGWSDFPTTIPAGTPAEADVPARTTARFQVGGRPLVYFHGDDVLVDTVAFSTLTVVDATNLGAGQRVPVGSVSTAARAALGDRGVAELLVVADVVRIYAHIEGEACLVEESRDGGAWRGRFTGEHVYFTNDENHAPLAFTVEIAADGGIGVVGG